jgi:hypothetical protein
MFSSATKEQMMSVTVAVALNAILAAAVVTALASVCRIPYRLDRAFRPRRLLAEAEAPQSTASERAA